ncbi:Ferrous iron transport protein A [Vibrio thalassae]|uniref:Ferrous iron transport protein A n=1 Tax=Vibrio thalassae TaxID=1243014 RepID=A0A240EFI6_9VIBR|nr:FeoA family protein [Vibrio thalassae]SNX47316.1 Ferrous iron transport protein A [Vibrio thalassae]
MKLAELKIGSSGRITALNGLNDDVRKKLMVMGILPNTEVKMVRRAPMGDPLQIEVRGVALAIRNNIANAIEVEAHS